MCIRDRPGKILVKVATSFTSIDNARKNLAAEIPGWNFNEVRQASSDIWNQALGQIAVKGNNEKEKVKFYSALYNAHFLPRTFSDVDGSYPRFDGDGQIMKMDHGTYSVSYTHLSGKEDVSLHLFTPAVQKQYDPKRNHTIVDYPKGNISFMNAIPAVGTKFGKAEDFGPDVYKRQQ